MATTDTGGQWMDLPPQPVIAQPVMPTMAQPVYVAKPSALEDLANNGTVIAIILLALGLVIGMILVNTIHNAAHNAAKK